MSSIKDMESNQKDTRKTSSFKTLSERSVSFLSETRADRVLYAVAHKLEKVIAATALVTEHSTTDAIAGELRQVAVASHAAAYRALVSRDPIATLSSVRTLSIVVDQYLSLLRAALISGTVSSMNADLLDREVGRILDAVTSLFSELSRGGTLAIDTRVLSSEMLASVAFDTERTPPSLSDFTTPSASVDRGYQQSVKPVESLPSQSLVTPKPIQKDIKDIKDIQKDKKKNQKDMSDSKGDVKKTLQKAFSSEDRKQEILTILRAHGESDISHITKLVSGYSSKTILRELNALIADGRITRHGNKRWSFYTAVR
jgi:hypothetical protein